MGACPMLMDLYDFGKIEKKWQERWEESRMYAAEDGSKRPKFYALIEFPYPSGDGLHVGHPRPYTALDVIARKKRMEGYNVLYPIGWDAFGLPTENYAIKMKQHPRVVTEKNIKTFTRQIKSLGISFDWSREINTTDPKYYKWTQWIFLQLFKKGLAYKKEMAVNWCPSCKIVLANEEVIDGKCERCGQQATRRMQAQWMLAITKYADRLLEDLETVDYSPRIKTQQVNWIGKSEGANLRFKISDLRFTIDVFTTRPDTIFGATYMVLAPEHELVSELQDKIENWDEVKKYIEESAKKSDLDRTELQKEKTGVELKGVKAINSANNEEIPIWIADYVLASYGTGAIMAVPAHDARDFEFAKKYGLPIQRVVTPFYEGTVKNDEITKERDVVFAVVKNPQDGKILCLSWNKTGWKSFPGGGVDNGDFVESARTEVLEETGYKNLKFIKEIGYPFYQHFWRPHKGSNVFGRFAGVLFELEDEERDEVETHEAEQHDFLWLEEGKVADFVTTSGPKQVWDWYVNGWDKPFMDAGVAVNSGEFDGVKSEEAKGKIVEWLSKKGAAEKTVSYKLRDWVFSRQHYWGEPIPLVYCEKCEDWIAVDEKDLPVELPDIEAYEPTDTGESPLAKVTDWVKTTCPKCGGEARRETDTMPNWAGSSWYFLRYCDPHNDKALADKKKLKYWTSVDLYNGGMEHTTLHLLYSRFWHKFLFDIGAVPTAEPYARRRSHGIVLAEDHQKMSKSRGNVVNPDDMVAAVGADALRLYEMFMGPFEQMIPWSTNGLRGMKRFLDRVWKLEAQERKDHRMTHKTIKKVTEDIDGMKFNTAISALMEYVNSREYDYAILLRLLAPFAPHITEEMWERLGNKTSVHLEVWPEYDPKLVEEDEFELVVQVNGKTRATVTAARGTHEEGAKKLALGEERVQTFLEDKEIKKVIFVADRLINFVV